MEKSLPTCRYCGDQMHLREWVDAMYVDVAHEVHSRKRQTRRSNPHHNAGSLRIY